MEESFSVLIVFKDNSYLELDSVINYTWKSGNCITVNLANGYNVLFNVDDVSYIGRKMDLTNES